MLKYIQVNHFRNIQHCELHFHPRLNWIVGENGSGKTSLLESLSCLSSARSFRTNNYLHLITHHEIGSSVFTELDNENLDKLGVGFSRQSGKEVKINGKKALAVSELASYLPVQVITPKVSQLIEEGPGQRRKFLDWGLFHVEHPYRSVLSRFTRILKQRNALLKSRSSPDQIQAWDTEFIESAKVVTRSRENYVNLLQSHLEPLLNSITDIPETYLQLYAGWPVDSELENCMKQSWPKDQTKQQTHYGPHRADLRIKSGRDYVKDIYSRGQIKLLASLLLIAQLRIMQQESKPAVFLIDDISSEFDPVNQKRILEWALQTKAQLVVTATSEHAIADLLNEAEYKMFHVEHGKFTEVV